VNLATVISSSKIIIVGLVEEILWLLAILLEPLKKKTARDAKIKASPIRLVNLVTIPEKRALGV